MTTSLQTKEIAAPSEAEVQRLLAPLLGWLLRERLHVTRTTFLFDQFVRRLVDVGLPIERATLHMPQLHPQLVARGLYWDRESGGAMAIGREHGIEQTDFYRNSPVRHVREGGGPVRCYLKSPECPDRFPIMDDLRAQGYSDYTARPIPFSSGQINTVTFAAKRPEGFSELDLAVMDAALPLFGAVLEIRHVHKTARVLLETYLGPHTGDRVLRGVIKRGDTEPIHAVLWYCDLRGFTALSEALPQPAVIALLNDYFDCMAKPVEARGGEILKFIGDAMLAIFPCDPTPDERKRAADNALAAAQEAVATLAALNRERRQNGAGKLTCGIALHIGEAMYGNIGGGGRMDFTVIGPAVNLVSRLEPLCARLNGPVVASAAFAAAASRRLRSLGYYSLKGIAEEQEAFTLP
ncbi:MAG: adenylate/guanylate cyclase domain-containing protein [Kiloniellales bacterium]|nr:adenylate/guanylate cyclase domain-containing protein [Kiloniellales bacterium]